MSIKAIAEMVNSWPGPGPFAGDRGDDLILDGTFSPDQLLRLAAAIKKEIVDPAVVEHTHSWGPNLAFSHTHRRGEIKHGHHGARYLTVGLIPIPIPDQKGAARES